MTAASMSSTSAYATQPALVDLIRGLTDEGITFVVSTHYPGFASTVGDACTILDGGQVAYRGDTLDGVDAETYGLRRFSV
ncbi:hypothetical protein ACOZ4L_15325 (plasmid) [Haloplanus ruber]|uniref:ABC transporter ATP-binding protein n=1 Tax=Haloplanus ruber TaxID=869892 RepID=A0ABD6CUI9_9EURY|nr:hypothetical protein [Haloplanus ruber]